MENVITNKQSVALHYLIVNVLGIALILTLPILSHALSLPLYYLEPMRISIFAAVLFANRHNAYALALALPMISFLYSGHPLFFKAIIISLELVLNVFLFYILFEKTKKAVLAVAASVVLSKVFYYGMKYLFIAFGLLAFDVVDTPIYIQFVGVGFLSLLAIVFVNRFSKQ